MPWLLALVGAVAPCLAMPWLTEPESAGENKLHRVPATRWAAAENQPAQVEALTRTLLRSEGRQPGSILEPNSEARSVGPHVHVSS